VLGRCIDLYYNTYYFIYIYIGLLFTNINVHKYSKNQFLWDLRLVIIHHFMMTEYIWWNGKKSTKNIQEYFIWNFKNFAKYKICILNCKLVYFCLLGTFRMHRRHSVHVWYYVGIYNIGHRWISICMLYIFYINKTTYINFIIPLNTPRIIY